MNNTEFRTGVIKPVECVKEGWELIKSEYWLLFAITLVGALIGGVTMYVARRDDLRDLLLLSAKDRRQADHI